MQCQRKGGLSATTKVKVLSPENSNIALGQGFCVLEACIATYAKGEYVSDVPGSESVAGKLTVHFGTWENHVVPNRSYHNYKTCIAQHNQYCRNTTSLGMAGNKFGLSGCKPRSAKAGQ